MADNTEELAKVQPRADEQDILNEDLFDFPCEENFAADIRLAHNPDGSQDDDIFDFAGPDAILESEGDLGNLSSGTRILEDFVDADKVLDRPATSEESAPAAPVPMASEVSAPSASTAPATGMVPERGSSELDEDIFNFDNPIDPDVPDPAPPLRHTDLIDKRAIADKAPDQPALIAQSAPAPTAALAATATPASSLPPVSEVARQSASEALAVAQAARLAILGQQPASTATATDTGWNRRMVISVAAAFLLVNASLIFIAGRLSQSMNSALNGVREDLTRSISVAQQAGSGARVLAPDGQNARPIDVMPAEASGPMALTDVANRELELAHAEIGGGDCPAARRRLYRLLANRDRLIVSADVLAESEFLVAESYFAEAKSTKTRKQVPIGVEAEQ